MICRIAGIRGSTPRMHDTPSCLGGGVHPWGRYLQISPIRAPIGWFLGCPGDEIAKTGAHCLRKTPDCLPIAGFSGFTASKKGPNRPNCAGDIYLHGLPYVGIPERGYGDPVRSTGTRVTMEIGSLTRQMTSPDPPTWGPGFTPWDSGGRCRIPHIRGTKSRKRGPIVSGKPRIAFRLADLQGLRTPKRDQMGPIVRAKIPRMGSQTLKKGNPDPGIRAGMPRVSPEQAASRRRTPETQTEVSDYDDTL